MAWLHHKIWTGAGPPGQVVPDELLPDISDVMTCSVACKHLLGALKNLIGHDVEIHLTK